MKKYFILFFIVNVLFCIYGYSQLPGPPYTWMYNWGTRYTPKGNPISAGVLKSQYELTEIEKDTLKEYYLWYYDNKITFISEATRSYNCHGYAWHVSEGQDNVWINTPNDDKYWTQGSYKETSSQNNAKVAFVESADHSAIRTSHPDTLISKWGQAPKFKHHKNDCQYEPKTNLKYYKLNPGINGTETALCANLERTFTSNTSIPGSTYTWTKDNNLLDYVSGSGSTSYRVKAKTSSGKAWLRLQITTPSGEVATTNYKYVWVGKQTLDDVTGPGYYPYEGCTNTEYSFSVSPLMDPLSQGTVTWSIIPSNGYIYPYYTNYAAITFYYPHAGYRVLANVQNACGTNYAETSIYIEDCYYFSISPNPASDIVTINRVSASEETDGKTIMMSSDDANTTCDIQIVDYYGSLHLQTTKSGDSFTLPVSNLKDGTYFVKITNGKKISNLKFVVKH